MRAQASTGNTLGERGCLIEKRKAKIYAQLTRSLFSGDTIVKRKWSDDGSFLVAAASGRCWFSLPEMSKVQVVPRLSRVLAAENPPGSRARCVDQITCTANYTCSCMYLRRPLAEISAFPTARARAIPGQDHRPQLLSGIIAIWQNITATGTRHAAQDTRSAFSKHPHHVRQGLARQDDARSADNFDRYAPHLRACPSLSRLP